MCVKICFYYSIICLLFFSYFNFFYFITIWCTYASYCRFAQLYYDLRFVWRTLKA